eukprot:CAMPEP_0206011516 /NCGR_PEP_ID=MMETSP1464-20131121/13352_1 /ASSEMBLY_ACC=CAM_ASM_001124 /TAXON_ID=119497 /ORGANISM="Exanthemachrysis gayraliae, Strain RCC1523" /LENGTH=91 /DNA_ID=CAMNT_0053385183 /DNA_START=179 /DNA_END=450 /DNA_ORIENTATION=-
MPCSRCPAAEARTALARASAADVDGRLVRCSAAGLLLHLLRVATAQVVEVGPHHAERLRPELVLLADLLLPAPPLRDVLRAGEEDGLRLAR